MLDDFFIRALLAGIGVALIAGPIGCFIIWRRMAYFGDTLAHAALLGIALAFALEVHPIIAVFFLCVFISMALLFLQKNTSVASDSLLGILSHGALALGMVAISFSSTIRIDLAGLLFGDILAVGKQDLAIIFMGGAGILIVLTLLWRPLFAATVNRELAEAEGINASRNELVFMALLACVIAVAMKIVGVLLITALLIIPAASARRFSSGPEVMALVSALIGAASVILGLFGSLEWDSPSGPSIVVAALAIFLLALLPQPWRKKKNAPAKDEGPEKRISHG